MDRELRFIRSDISVQERIVSGYAIRFNEDSVDLGGFIESVSPSALSVEQVQSSDIFAFFNHDDEKVLGRTGAGTLRLELRPDGLYYEIDVPNTQAGNDLLEHISRGEMYGTSFAFTIAEDGDVWTKDNEGNIHREITNIEMLYEVSPVYSPAYPTTSVSARAIDMIENLQKNDNTDMKQEDIRRRSLEDEEEIEKEEDPNEEIQDDENREGCENEEDEEREDEENEDMEEKEDEDEVEEKEDEEDPEEEKKRSKRKINKKTKRNKNKKSITMEKRFSLLSAIRSIANGQKLDAASQAVVDMGMEEMRKAGQSYSGQIQLPVGELRADPPHYTVAADGEHVVVTDYLNILEPLKAKNVLVAAGANYLTGLQGNLQIPSMTAENVYWEGEIDDTDNGAGSFSHVNMAPRRLSAYIDISKQFLVQDTLGAENLIRKLLVEAINDKLEATILSDAAADGAKPAGIFYNVTPTEITNYADVCDFEAELDEANFVGDFKYVINPKAKAALRSMIKGTNATGMIMENNAIDGTPTEMTTHMDTNTLAYGDWSQLYIGQWGGIDLVVDNFTQATKGCVRLVINAFFDYKVVRDGAIVYGEVVADDSSNG